MVFPPAACARWIFRYRRINRRCFIARCRCRKGRRISGSSAVVRGARRHTREQTGANATARQVSAAPRGALQRFPLSHPIAKTCRLWLPLERLRRQTRQDLEHQTSAFLRRSRCGPNCTPGSVRGSRGNPCPYLDNHNDTDRLRADLTVQRTPGTAFCGAMRILTKFLCWRRLKTNHCAREKEEHEPITSAMVVLMNDIRLITLCFGYI